MPSDVILLRTQFLGVGDTLLESVLRRTGEQLLDAGAPFGARMQRVIETCRSLGQAVVALQHVFEQVTVRPDAVGGIAGVLLTLQPVAIDDVDRDLPYGIGPDEQVPPGQGRRRQRPQIGENEAAQLAHRVSSQLGLEGAVGTLHRPVEAFAVGTVEPAMIRAAKPAFIGNPELHVDETVQAAIADQPEAAAAIPVEDEILAEHPNLAHRIVLQLGERCNRDPVAAHELAARGTGSNAGQPLVGFGTQHRGSSQFFRLHGRLASSASRAGLSRHRAQDDVRAGPPRVRHPPSAADLKLLHHPRQIRLGTSNRKAALES